MARNVGISARISGDPKPLKQAQQQALVETQQWVNRMVGINNSVLKSYSSLAFSGPAVKQMSPIAQLADADAKAWARRMSDTDRMNREWAQRMRSGTGTAILYTAQAVDDLQYGIKGVLNNIPQLVMAFGGGAGLAGVLALVAVGAATVGKKFWDWWTNAKRLKEVTTWVDEINKKLEETSKRSAKEALEGTAAGAEALANAVERANEALAENQRRIAEQSGRNKEMIAAKAALDEANIGGEDAKSTRARGQIQIEAAKELHRETIAAAKAEMEASAAKAKALDDYATKAAAAATEARAKANSLDPGANDFIKESTLDKAAAAEKDAAEARAAADKAHTESIKEQQRIAGDIAHKEALFAKELALLWKQVDDQVADADQRARDKQAAEKKALEDEKAAAEKKAEREDEAQQAQRRRELEARQRELERDMKRQARAASTDGAPEVSEDRGRRINARAKPARKGHGVDDVIAYRNRSLRGEMDSYIGPVGNRRDRHATDRQAAAHQARMQKARDGDPLLSELQAVKKELAEINKNTSGMSKGRSEPLRRN